MNFLAHFHLAWPDEGLVAGGLEGDYYKGPLRGDLPRDIERGVQLHRAIDAYTDGHPLIQQLRRDLPQSLRRYAGILIDLSFDHYLSRHWSTFSDIPLRTFNDQVYRTLSAHKSALSDGSRTMLARMVEFDILGLYVDWEAVPASAARVGSASSATTRCRMSTVNCRRQGTRWSRHFWLSTPSWKPSARVMCDD